MPVGAESKRKSHHQPDKEEQFQSELVRSGKMQDVHWFACLWK